MKGEQLYRLLTFLFNTYPFSCDSLPTKEAKILISEFFSFNFHKWPYMAHSHTIHPAVLSSANVSLLMKKS